MFGLAIPDVSTATKEEIRVGFLKRVRTEAKRMLLRDHPDKQAGRAEGERLTKEQAEEKTRQINECRRVLDDWVEKVDDED